MHGAFVFLFFFFWFHLFIIFHWILPFFALFCVVNFLVCCSQESNNTRVLAVEEAGFCIRNNRYWGRKELGIATAGNLLFGFGA
ncbi:hypothetical protein QR685DRAFT_511238 [Neurospora intermedia]|uniref:Secreted protein n=1 Tax=Neurospora intermedia TaxID=5142 RepID=A0ABR3DQK1_NEUIN